MTEPETKQEDGATRDPFGQVLGAGRGITDAPATQEQLQAAERKLAESEAALQIAESRARDLQAEVTELEVTVATLTNERDQEKRWARQAEAAEDEAFIERDRARYAAMRCGQQDPCGHAPKGDAEYQGEWTPGRPYLAYQHAEHPKTKECYRASSTGAPAGELPGTGRHWQRCLDPDACPIALTAPTGAHRLALSGAALRETMLCWRTELRRAPSELSEEELEHVIGFLRTNAAAMCAEEWGYNRMLVPCPVNAFPSAAAWMADTLLMRALTVEQRRRRRRRARTRSA
jgi:hypothetical protein